LIREGYDLLCKFLIVLTLLILAMLNGAAPAQPKRFYDSPRRVPAPPRPIVRKRRPSTIHAARLLAAIPAAANITTVYDAGGRTIGWLTK
jgi:hypothetical protein